MKALVPYCDGGPLLIQVQDFAKAETVFLEISETDVVEVRGRVVLVKRATGLAIYEAVGQNELILFVKLISFTKGNT